jgi:ABC-type microcin C transport system duplicated ATPase subunit YejF
VDWSNPDLTINIQRSRVLKLPADDFRVLRGNRMGMIFQRRREALNLAFLPPDRTLYHTSKRPSSA